MSEIINAKKIQVLDHGYVLPIEVWGSDESIICAARMSTNKGFLGWEPGICPVCNGLGDDNVNHEFNKCQACEGKGKIRGDKFLLAHLYNETPKHCYDEQTEVLTKRGFVKWSDITTEDELGQWDESIGSLIYDCPISLTKSTYKGKMYRVDHGGVDLLVTSEHKMFVKTKYSVPGLNKQEWTPNWNLIKSSELGNKSMVRYRKHAPCTNLPDIILSQLEYPNKFPENNDPRALLRLIGFFIGNGFAPRDEGGINGIMFHLKKDRKVNYLRELCLELGWRLEEQAASNYVVKVDGIGRLFRKQFYDINSEKIIPSYLHILNKWDALALLDGLKNSDGSIKRGTWDYSTTSNQVAESMQLIGLHAGEAVHVTKGNYLHRVSVLSRMTEPIINQGKVNTSWEDYNGMIYCAHTKTGVLIIRRNGKIVLSGNSTPFEMAGLVIECQAPIMVYREWHRHRTQSYNEMSARYTPLPNNNYIPTPERCLVVQGKNKQANKADGAGELTHEQALEWLQDLEDTYESCERTYQKGLEIGIPKELARLCLPVGRYSRMRASTCLLNWLRFLSLRNHPKAQAEIRYYAQVVQDILTEHFPRTMALFTAEQASIKLRLEEKKV